MVSFTKMHGLGNDYIIVNAIEEQLENPADFSKKYSNRHFGIGSDGLILVTKSDKADFRMRMFNSDGSEAEMCGNGIRIFAKYVYDRKMIGEKKLDVETLAGIIKPEVVEEKNGKATSIKVDMGEPVLDGGKIPVNIDMKKVVDEEIELKSGSKQMTCVSMGNPHAIFFVDSFNFEIENLGSEVENHPFFPNRTNVEFIQVLNDNEINFRVWERGAGVTLACGTGACAAVVASVLNNKTGRHVTVHLLGGDLNIEWNKKDNHVYMTGSAEEVFSGEVGKK